MRRPASRERILALALFAAALASAAACRRRAEAPMPPLSTDPALKRIDQPLTAITAPPLLAATPDPHGLVASILARPEQTASTPSASASGTSSAEKAAATPEPYNPFAGVPLVPSRTPSGRIEWSASFAEGYREAVERNKAMVVVFGSPGGEWHEKVVASFENPELAALADRAIWIRSDPTKETMGRNVCTALGVAHTPTLSVLDPDPEMISEELRVEGYEEPAKLARDLDAPLKRANGQLQRVPTMRP